MLCDLLLFQKSSTQALIPVEVPVKALMPTMLVQEHKDKTITHTVHEVLMWFGQPCLRPQMNMRTQCLQKEVGVAPQKYEP